MFCKEILDPKIVGKETVEFVKYVVPDMYRAHTKKWERAKADDKANPNGRLLVDEEYTTPLKLLMTHPYFNEFRMKWEWNKNKI